jgi:hypothetical protein
MPAPSAGFSIYSGTGGDFLAATLSYTSGFDVFVIPGSPPTPTTFVEMSKWDISVPLAYAKFFGFGSPANASGVLGPILLRGGRCEWKVTVEGSFNGDSGSNLNTNARLAVNTPILFTLLLNKVTGAGYIGLAGKVMSFGVGADVGSTDPSFCRVEIDGQGVPPVFGFTP